MTLKVAPLVLGVWLEAALAVVSSVITFSRLPITLVGTLEGGKLYCFLYDLPNYRPTMTNLDRHPRMCNTCNWHERDGRYINALDTYISMREKKTLKKTQERPKKVKGKARPTACQHLSINRWDVAVAKALNFYT
jgi:hypothetical protein